MKAILLGVCWLFLSGCAWIRDGEPLGGLEPADADSGPVESDDAAPSPADSGGGSAEAFHDWPAGASPTEVGTRVAENFLSRPFRYQEGATTFIQYRETIAWYGALAFAALIQDQPLEARVVARFDPILTPEGASIIPSRAMVDDRVFGIVPLQIYLQRADERYLSIGKDLADQQWKSPTADGITSEARYWIDDMFMITALQVQAFRATADAQYVDRTALTMATYLDRLQQPNGLFFHTRSSPVFWGRGNGWVAAGMTELLSSLPADHPRRARIFAAYQTMMAALLQYQTPEGTWRQILDLPDAWPETSGSGMFAFAFASGVKRGWLDAATYGPLHAPLGSDYRDTWTPTAMCAKSAPAPAKPTTKSAPTPPRSSSTISTVRGWWGTTMARPRFSGLPRRCSGNHRMVQRTDRV